MELTYRKKEIMQAEATRQSILAKAEELKRLRGEDSPSSAPHERIPRRSKGERLRGSACHGSLTYAQRYSRSRSPPGYAAARYSGGRDDTRDRGYDEYRPQRDGMRRRSRSRSFERRRGSRSPPPRSDYRPKRIHPADRPPAEACKVLGVFGLSIHTRERDLEELFGRYGRVTSVNIIYDKHTAKSRGFGFITFDDVESATKAKEEMNRFVLNQREMRVDYSLTKRPHSPTPGRYMGDPQESDDRRSYFWKAKGLEGMINWFLQALLLYVLLGGATAVKFEIPAALGPGFRRCILQYMNKDLLAVGHFEVGDGHAQRIDVEIFDDSATPNRYWVKPNVTPGSQKFSFTTHIAGNVHFCFSNILAEGNVPGPAFTKTIALHVDTGADAQEATDLFKEKKLKPMEMELFRLERLAEQVIRDMEDLKVREEEMRNINGPRRMASLVHEKVLPKQAGYRHTTLP
ncbi:transformer 2 beta [Dinochytrium kinnereticum]|nr:transformer 2 beta [Dinochytrium kinnereticum]